jgi:catechol-2,3-dioxygenase
MRFLDVRIASPDPSRAASFYASALAAEPIDDGVRIGATTLRFEHSPPPAPYHVAFAIPPGSIRSAFDWAQPRLAMLSDEIFDFPFWNAEALYFEDPDGNVLELIARRGGERSFATRDIAGICELGLPVADPPNAIGSLEAELGLGVFSGDRDAFTAVGDAEGLFIVVRPGRNWLPTQLAATEAPALVTVESPRQGEVRLGPVTIVSVARAARPLVQRSPHAGR